MKRKIIIRIIIEDRQSLGIVGDHILSNLTHQSTHDFKCFIEYPREMEKDIKDLEQQVYKLDGIISFIPKEETYYYDGQCEKRLLIEEIERYITGLNLMETDELFFMLWPTDKIYTLNIVKELIDYKIQEKEKVLTIPSEYLVKEDGIMQSHVLEKDRGFIYLCNVKEYWNYFKIYDLIMGFNFEQFKDFPRKELKKLTYKLCHE